MLLRWRRRTRLCVCADLRPLSLVINRSLACTRVSCDHELVQNRILVGKFPGFKTAISSPDDRAIDNVVTRHPGAEISDAVGAIKEREIGYSWRPLYRAIGGRIKPSRRCPRAVGVELSFIPLVLPLHENMLLRDQRAGTLTHRASGVFMCAVAFFALDLSSNDNLSR